MVYEGHVLLRQRDKPPNLRLVAASTSPSRASEVTTEIHAVSLQASSSLSHVDMLLNFSSRSAVINLWIIIADMEGTYAILHDSPFFIWSREGEVVAVGVDVERWKVGDCVCCNFVLEHVCGDLKQEIKASDLGGDTDGVLRKYINPVYYPYSRPLVLRRGFDPTAAAPESMKRGDSVLALRNRRCVDIALASGANVIVTFSSDEKLEIAKKMGAWHRINRKKMPNWDEEITGGRRITGGSNTLQQSSGAVKDSGCVHIISFVSGGKQEIPVNTVI
ncbi:hypothetical protein BKA82DRAFT_28320 [Pisolithus tinctorius]|uniref:Alcohol dehydrogenase-like C-terminal domain-containing protein n=1 Tax=Pisolithus tinctorius Marx 270 TaxID=870435 RepID=A0A0C3NLK0_PISTI|nr:hypothetical protein BKA82DRAFT_28320 [Pisolithus tinctorius]KIO01820.1 hypothetical protein M404DRAFT_28320 [Pisolithus tinctorius Marx 270]